MRVYRDHDHETNPFRGMKFLVEKLIRAGHLKRYVWEPAWRTETALVVERVIASENLPTEPLPTINYVLGCTADDQYQSKRQRRKMLRAAMVRARINTINTPNNDTSIQQSTTPYPFLLLTRPGSLLHIMMPLFLLCVLIIMMCTEFSLILVAQLTYCTFQPSGR